MIVTHLAGGLGNQMFQYAAGLALAVQNSDRLALDATAFEGGQGRRETVRTFGLRAFAISAPVLEPADAWRYRNPLGHLSRLQRLINRRLLRRYYADWHPAVMRRRGDVYLEGYFQSPNYFAAIEQRVRTEFTLRPEGLDAIADLREEIAALGPGAVALHVRRGDYVSDDRASRLFNVCTTDYYRRAIARMQAEVPDFRLVLFSDDIAWVTGALPEASGALVISGRPGRHGASLQPAEELSLIAACPHAIISNSTFGWWGAFLNQNPARRVIAPARWTNEKWPSHPNILPPEWTTLSP